MNRLLKKVLRPAWRALRPAREAANRFSASALGVVVRVVVAHRRSRALLNIFYQRLGSKGQQAFYELTGGCFREGEHTITDGDWTLNFAGSTLRLPLTSNRIWLDWESALAALGHEPFLKNTYRAVLTGECPPEIFVDIGANYGNHSLLFLVSGVDTLTFEPNTSCHAYFQEACRLNGLQARLHGVALGASRGEIEMSYPPRETWLGTIEASVIERLSTKTDLVTQRVQVRPLDEYYQQLRGRRVLIKIDAEGHEVSVLKGAAETLRQLRPPVLFESWNDNSAQRRAILSMFREMRYLIADVPLLPGKPASILDEAAFVASQASDFLAIAAECMGNSSSVTADSLFSTPADRCRRDVLYPSDKH